MYETCNDLALHIRVLNHQGTLLTYVCKWFKNTDAHPSYSDLYFSLSSLPRASIFYISFLTHQHEIVSPIFAYASGTSLKLLRFRMLSRCYSHTAYLLILQLAHHRDTLALYVSGETFHASSAGAVWIPALQNTAFTFRRFSVEMIVRTSISFLTVLPSGALSSKRLSCAARWL